VNYATIFASGGLDRADFHSGHVHPVVLITFVNKGFAGNADKNGFHTSGHFPVRDFPAAPRFEPDFGDRGK
jgi:hypothetical protein